MGLLEQNPALGFCAANLARFRTLFGNLGKQAAELSCQPQRDILDWLGFPDTQAWVNVFRRILPETVTVGRVQTLRDVAGVQEMAKRLAHLPVINTGVLELACQPQLLGLVTPGATERDCLGRWGTTPRVGSPPVSRLGGHAAAHE